MPSRRDVLIALAGVAGIFSYPVSLEADPTEYDATATVAVERGAPAAFDHPPDMTAVGKLVSIGQVDSRSGLPTFVWADRVQAAAVARTTRPIGAGPAARAHLQRLAPLWRLAPGDPDQFRLLRVHDSGRGGIIASFGQELDGVEVFRERMQVLMDRDLELVAVSGHLPSGSARSPRPAFTLDAPNVLAAALLDFGIVVASASIAPVGEAVGPYRRYAIPDGLPPVRAKRVLFRLGDALEPAWYFEIHRQGEAWAYVMSATDGRPLFRHDLTAHESYTYRVWADGFSPWLPHDGPQGTTASPHPTGTPNFYSPPFQPPALVTLEHGAISTNDPWLPPGAVETTGNNVDAYADLNPPDGFSAGDLRAGTTASGVFDRVYDPTLQPDASADQRMAAITQLFYSVNALHDWYYDAGFDEVSGNAQTSNFGRGGLEGDALLAEAQSHEFTNNASMTTPADGAPARMQMGVWAYANGAKLTLDAPPGLVGDKEAGSASFAPSTFTTSGELVLVNDGVGTTTDACEPFVNAVAGKIVVMDLSNCSAASKAQRAESAGAIGVVVVGSQPNAPPPPLFDSPPVGIGVISVTLELGAQIKAALAGGTVTGTISTQPQVSRDSDIDAFVIAHEYGHLISGRLIGDASGLTTNQSRSMNEGWSDFHTLLVTVRPEDALVTGNESFQGAYPEGAYISHRSYTLNNAYYFGARRYPYSTDLAKNPLTFRHIQSGVPLPVGPPVAFGANGALNATVHRSGEVWCNMLWECYAALLRDTARLTFDEARDRMRVYLIAGQKMTPINPTFTEARDALLSVVRVNDATDFDLFCQAFARRGLGSGALSPDRLSTTHSGVVESFACGGALYLVAASLEDDAATCDADRYVDNGETGFLKVTLRNGGSTALNATTMTVSSAHTAVSFPQGNSIAFPASGPYTQISAALPVAINGASGLQAPTFTVQYDDPGLLVAGPRTASYANYVNADETPSTIESVETLSPPWTSVAAPGGLQERWRRLEVGPTIHRFFVSNPPGVADVSLVSPLLHLGPGTFSFTFQQAYAFEYSFGVALDGGVIELSNDDGATWVDIGGFATPGYNGTIRSDLGNPLAGRPAYTNQNAGYPALQNVTVNLGTAYAGDTVRVRFRMGSDLALAATGWSLDQLSFPSVLEPPFKALIADPTPCAAPVAVGDRPRPGWEFTLAGANPVREEASFRFSMAERARLTIDVYDLAGRNVARVAHGDYAAGSHQATWTPSWRGAVSAGVYFARLRAGGFERTLRLVIAR